MEDRELSFRRLDPASDKEIIKELFSSVFCAAPWYDDWSDPIQLDSYIKDLTGQDRSLSYGLFEADEMIGLALGNIRHWYSGTEYMIDEFCIRTDRQGRGLGSYFMKKIENDLRT
ncbi:MAG: GNAT family N-acetyltransferase, partial [Oscillospiraceae bacterium]|nr:GNAT family N-acetyltransferase [Oscillospiraceae bacterium]